MLDVVCTCKKPAKLCLSQDTGSQLADLTHRRVSDLVHANACAKARNTGQNHRNSLRQQLSLRNQGANIKESSLPLPQALESGWWLLSRRFCGLVLMQSVMPIKCVYAIESCCQKHGPPPCVTAHCIWAQHTQHRCGPTGTHTTLLVAMNRRSRCVVTRWRQVFCTVESIQGVGATVASGGDSGLNIPGRKGSAKLWLAGLPHHQYEVPPRKYAFHA